MPCSLMNLCSCCFGLFSVISERASVVQSVLKRLGWKCWKAGRQGRAPPDPGYRQAPSLCEGEAHRGPSQRAQYRSDLARVTCPLLLPREPGRGGQRGLASHRLQVRGSAVEACLPEVQHVLQLRGSPEHLHVLPAFSRRRGRSRHRDCLIWRVAFVMQVSLKRRQKHFCGGTIVSAQWVVTAAHCILDRYGWAISGAGCRCRRTWLVEVRVCCSLWLWQWLTALPFYRQYFLCFNRKGENRKPSNISITKNKINLQGLVETDFRSVGKSLYLTRFLR